MISTIETQQKVHQQRKEKLLAYLSCKDWDSAKHFVQMYPFYLGEVLHFAETLKGAEQKEYLRIFSQQQNVKSVNQSMKLQKQLKHALQTENWLLFFQTAYPLIQPDRMSMFPYQQLHFVEMGTQFLQEQKVEQAMWSFYFAVRFPHAEPEAWNDLFSTFHQLSEKQLPPLSVMEELIQKVLGIAPLYPAIYHHLACFYSRNQFLEKAIQAVIDAIKYGYSLLEEMKQDQNLFPLHSDLRWKTLFPLHTKSSPPHLIPSGKVVSDLSSDMLPLLGSLPLSKFTFWKQEVEDQAPLIRAQTVFQIVFLLEGDLPQVAEQIALALEWFLDTLPQDTLRFYQTSEFESAIPIPKGMIKRTISLFKNFPAHRPQLTTTFKSSSPVGDYLFSVFGASLHHHACLMFHFPALAWEQQGIERFVEALLQLANILSFQSGYAGFTFVRESEFKYRELASRLSQRFLGAAPFESLSIGNVDKLCSTQFLTFVGQKMLKKIGGKTTIKKALPEAKMYSLSSGICIRSSWIPPIGYPSLAAQDLGLLSEVVHFFRPWLEDRVETKPWFDKIEIQMRSSWHNPKLYTE